MSTPSPVPIIRGASGLDPAALQLSGIVMTGQRLWYRDHLGRSIDTECARSLPVVVHPDVRCSRLLEEAAL